MNIAIIHHEAFKNEVNSYIILFMDISGTADSKILILYLVKNAPGVSYQMLMDKCMESLYTDFFVFSQCYNELIAGNLMDKEEKDTGTGEVVGNNETLRITAGGEAILEDVTDTINKQVLGYLRKAAQELKDAVEEQNSVTAFSEMLADGSGRYKVTLSRLKDGRDFTCNFLCEDKTEADNIVNSWRNSSFDSVYLFINSLLK